MERRTQALARFMGRVASHACLQNDATLRDFLENTDKVAIPKPKSDGGILAVFKLGEFRELDEWFSDKVKELSTLETQISKLHKATDGLVNRRKDLSTSVMTFTQAFVTLAQAEDLPALSKVMQTLADVEAKVAKLQLSQVLQL